MIQSGGDAEFYDLAIAYIDGSTGSYTLSGGTLTTGKAVITTGGGAFTQSGGVHTVNETLDIKAGQYAISGGQLNANETKVHSSGTLTTSGNATLNMGTLDIESGGTLALLGGTLDVDTASIQGTVNFGTGTGEFNLIDSGILDLSGASFVGGDYATLNTPADSLILVAPGVDLDSQIGNFNNGGTLAPHTVGTTLTIPASAGFGGKGTVSDFIVIQGDGHIIADTGQGITLTGGLDAGPDSNIQLGTGKLEIYEAGSVLDNVQLDIGSINIINTLHNTGELVASGTINTARLMFEEVRTNFETLRLEIGPGTDSLTINYINIQFSPFDEAYDAPEGDKLTSIDFELAGTQTGEYDRLILTENTPGGGLIAGFATLSLETVGAYTPVSGDRFDIITLTYQQTMGIEQVLGLDDIPGITLGVVYDAGGIAIVAHNKADINDDGIVGSGDMQPVLDYWNQNVAPGDLDQGDLSGDGYVDNDDADIVFQGAGHVLPTGQTLTLYDHVSIEDADQFEASGYVYVTTLSFDDDPAVSGTPSLAIGPGTAALSLYYDHLDLAQTASETSVIDFELAGTQTGEYDQLILTEFTPGTSDITGEATISIAAQGSYVPVSGDSFDIITLADDQTLNIRQVLGLDDIPDITLGVSYDAGGITIVAHNKADINDDGIVGLSDLQPILDYWNQNVTPGDLLQGDLTGDGYVGDSDLQIMLDNWDSQYPPPSAPTPEPSTLVCLLMAGLPLIRRSSRKIA